MTKKTGRPIELAPFSLLIPSEGSRPPNGDRLRNWVPTFIKERGEVGVLGIDALADTYWHIRRQRHSAWTQEIDLRPFKETF